MSGIARLFSDITPDKLISHILYETGQEKSENVAPKPIIEFLKLKYLPLDITEIPPDELELPPNDPFRALFYYPERVLATDYTLSPDRRKFSIFHEIAHYLLPGHQDAFYLCLESDMSEKTVYITEQQANRFAADLMFHADLFTRMANEMPVCAKTIKELAIKFGASFESTARRLVEKSLTPCLLVIYEKKPPTAGLNTETQTLWDVKYSVPSSSFPYRIKDDPANPIVQKLGSAQGLDIADSITEESEYTTSGDKNIRFRDEYFTNSYNVFRIMVVEGKIE